MAEANGHRTSIPHGAWRLIANQLSRLGLAARLGSMHHGKREVHQLLGYKEQLTYQDFLARYMRQDIAAVLVNTYPEKTWGMPPRVAEEGDHTTPTAFEQAWEALAKRLNLFNVLERADVLAQLGHYSVLLLGLRNQPLLGQEAVPVRGPEDLLYVQLYSEEHAKIDRFYEDPSLATYGQPQAYRLHPGETDVLVGTRRPQRAVMTVHASRIIHVAGEELLDDEIYGIPRLERMYDNLDDLLMIRGGAAYGWWQDAKRRFIMALRDGYSMPDDQAAALTQEAENFDLLKNFMQVAGMDVTAVKGEAASPRDHFLMEIDLLAAASRIGKRILLGSERGELSADQDERELLSRVARRQEKYAGPRLVCPFVDRCQALRILPVVRTGYVLYWENLLTMSEGQQATIAKDVATALHTYAPGMASAIVPPEQFVDEYLGIEFQGSADLEALVPEDEALTEDAGARAPEDREPEASTEDAA